MWEYIVERLRAYFLDPASAASVANVSTEMFDAVRAGNPVSPLDFGARLNALATFLALPEAASLTAANKRIANILKKSGGAAPPAPWTRRTAARACGKGAARSARGHAEPGRALRCGKRDYAAALAQLATLRPVVDAFFDGVMVNAEDANLRRNRLALLAQLRQQFTRIADLSCLPG